MLRFSWGSAVFSLGRYGGRSPLSWGMRTAAQPWILTISDFLLHSPYRTYAQLLSLPWKEAWRILCWRKWIASYTQARPIYNHNRIFLIHLLITSDLWRTFALSPTGFSLCPDEDKPAPMLGVLQAFQCWMSITLYHVWCQVDDRGQELWLSACVLSTDPYLHIK